MLYPKYREKKIGAMLPAPYLFCDGGCSAQACLWRVRVLAMHGWGPYVCFQSEGADSIGPDRKGMNTWEKEQSGLSPAGSEPVL